MNANFVLKYTFLVVLLAVTNGAVYANPFSTTDATDHVLVAQGASGLLTKFSYGDLRKRRNARRHRAEMAAMEIRKQRRGSGSDVTAPEADNVPTDSLGTGRKDG